jgi:hypothetical protein
MVKNRHFPGHPACKTFPKMTFNQSPPARHTGEEGGVSAGAGRDQMAVSDNSPAIHGWVLDTKNGKVP